jgi:uncharacterized protein (DUF362 family)
MTSKRTLVAISETKNAMYPQTNPYNPPEVYPEYPFGSTIDKENNVYSAVRDLFIKLALDQDNLGKPCWNPFGCFIKPGDKVVIKPNLVVDSHYLSEVNFISAVTHGSIIRPIIDYTYLALKGTGKIIVADGPIDLADFNDTTQKNGLFQTVNYLKTEFSVPVELLDLREERLKKISSFNLGKFELSVWIRDHLSGDPLDYVMVDLKGDSEFEEIADKCQYIRSTQLIHNKYEPTYHHRLGKHEYSMAKTILDSDVVINVPKLKAHKKTGNTINLKNTIGTIVPRHWMPHFRQNHDEYDNTVGMKQKIIKYLWSFFHINGIGCILIKNRLNSSEIEIGGSNPNNDTLWRAILDVNKILFYADKNGNMKNTQQRKYFSIVDGIIGGEKNSPLAPSPKETKLIIGGFDPVAVDYISTEIMGFDYIKIKTITNAFKLMKYPLGITNPSEITTIGEWSSGHFIPPTNWIGHIEKLEPGLLQSKE